MQIPFGNVRTVKELMQINADVEQPANQHPKRPVVGLQCKIDEPSGMRVWNLLHKLADGSLQTFAEQCFVHNFCPLAYFDANCKNITPSSIKVRNLLLQ